MVVLTWVHDSTEAYYYKYATCMVEHIYNYIGWKHNKEISLDGNKCLIVCHPHGISPMSGIYFSHHRIPVVVDKRVIKSCVVGSFAMKYCGFIDNSKESIVKNIEKHKMCAIYPGGADETCIGTGTINKTRVYLRTGLIRLCIENKYDLIPTLTPHDEVLLKPFFVDSHEIKHKIWKTIGIPAAMHKSASIIPFVPIKVDNPTIFFGKRIECKKTDSVKDVLVKYIRELKDLSTKSNCEIDFYNMEDLKKVHGNDIFE